MMALPGSAYVYQGEELGLEQVDVEPEHRTDPSWFRTGEAGRDGCRVPMPWSGTSAPYGFGTGQEQPWLPMPADWAGLTVEAQSGDDASTLTFFRRMLRLRREVTTGLPESVEVLDLRTGHPRTRSRRPGRRGQLRHRPGGTARRGRRAAAEQRHRPGGRAARTGHRRLVPPQQLT